MRIRVNRGFTLIELLIVVAIIAILALIAVPNFLEAQVRSKVARAKADMRTLVTGLESYRVDANHYPPASEADRLTRIPMFQRWAKITTPVAYLTSIPSDPFFAWIIIGVDLSPLWDGPGYEYFEREFSQLKTPPWGPDPGEQKALYFIKSFGPDRKNSATVVSNGGTWYTYIRYDPTNGTVTEGDIVRFGP